MPIRKFLAVTAFLFAPFIFIFGLITILAIYNQNNSPAYGQTVTYAALPSSRSVLGATIAEDSGARAEKIRQFLARYNSPLEPNAQDIVDAADQYGLDYRLLPAIAMQESTLCKKIPVNSYNCWGYGIYGDKVTRFADYKEGIYVVTKALATRYKDRGLVTPEQIMSMYTPSSNGSWARGVNFVINQL